MQLEALETMTLDQVDQWMALKKGEIEALRAEYDAGSAIRARLVTEADLAEATRQLHLAAERAGISVQAQLLKWSVEGDPGQMVQARLYARANNFTVPEA